MEKTKRILLCFLKVLIPDYEFENVEQLMKDERCMRVVAIFTKTFSSQKNFLSLVDKAYEEQNLRKRTFLLPIQFENDEDNMSYEDDSTLPSTSFKWKMSFFRNESQETVQERGNVEEIPLAQKT